MRAPAPFAGRLRAAAYRAMSESKPTRAKLAAPASKDDASQEVIASGAPLGPTASPSSTAPRRERCPAEMAFVDGRVCVDRWEASLVEVLPDGERQWSPFAAVDGRERDVRAVSRPGVIPQGYISGRQARIACKATGKRLCSASEWESACRGPARTLFPYGDARQSGVCNDDMRRLHPMGEITAMLGLKPEETWTTALNSPLINQLPHSLLPTGDRAECTNAYGVYDMVGNLHEWIDDPRGTFRGGYYMDTSQNGDGCNYMTTAHDFAYHDYSTGFRCCMDPEPGE